MKVKIMQKTFLTVALATLVILSAVLPANALYPVLLPSSFTMSASPNPITINAGSSQSTTLSITSVNSFSGNVLLSVSPQSSGITVQLPMSPIGPLNFPLPGMTITAGGTSQGTVTISVPSTVTPGPYSITIYGKYTSSTGAVTTESTTITVNVPQPIFVTCPYGEVRNTNGVCTPIVSPLTQSFTMSSNPSSLTISAGSSAPSTLTLTANSQRSGNLAIVNPPSGITVSNLPQIFYINPPNLTTDTVTISVASTVPAGTYTITIYGKYTSSTGAVTTESTTITLTVPRTFQTQRTLSLNPTHGPVGIPITLSGSGYQTSITPTARFVAPGIGFSSPVVVNLDASGNIQSTVLTVPSTIETLDGTTATVTPGSNYEVTISGAPNGGSTVRAFTVDPTPSTSTQRTLSLNPTHGPVGIPITLSGSGYQTSITPTARFVAPGIGFSSPVVVNLDASGNIQSTVLTVPSTIETLDGTTATVTPGSNYEVTISGAPNGGSTVRAFTVDPTPSTSTQPAPPTITSPTSQASVNSQVTISGTVPTGSSATSTVTVTVSDSTGIICTAQADPNGNWSCQGTITATGQDTLSATDSSNGQISATSTSVTINVETTSPPQQQCPRGETWDTTTQQCVTSTPSTSCPQGATGTYPSCTCSQGYTYDPNANQCVTSSPQQPPCLSGQIYDPTTQQCVTSSPGPSGGPPTPSFTQAPAVVASFFSGNSLAITNQNTNSQLSNYVTVQSVPDRYADQNLGIQGQYVTTVAFQDRYGRPESNNNLNVFLQISHTIGQINSMRGVELGGDQILAGLPSMGPASTSLVNSAEISIPQGSAGNIPQKVRDTLNANVEPAQTPQPVLDFLNNEIDLVNKVTGDHIAHYILVQSVPDIYAQNKLGIQGQYVTTLAFEDRYGRQDSNGNLNVFLQLSHTDTQVNSLRGVQLGGDDIEVFVNGVDEGTITKTVEIPMSSASTTGQAQSPTGTSGQSQNSQPAPTSESSYGYFKTDKSQYAASANPSDMVTISGKLSNPQGGNVVFTITKPDGTTIPINADVTSVGDFTTFIMLDNTYPAGSYALRGNYQGSDMGSVTFVVQ